jgi:uncharacterized protein YhaN
VRFLSLGLKPYGSLLDHLYEFEGEDPGGLHLIYGPNGAGKTTTLRAIRAVLYGMSSREDASHRVARDLRLYAHLRHSNGSTIHYCRRTATNNPLWNATDEEPIPEESLTPFLGGLDRARFETLYGLDLKTLTEGGKDLLTGEGELGRALYGAGLGGTQLARTIAHFDQEIEALYKDQGQKPKINALLKRYQELQKELRQIWRSPSAFEEQRRELNRLRKEVEQLDGRRKELFVESKAREKLLRAVAPLERWKVARDQLQKIGERDPLPETHAQRVQMLNSREGIVRSSIEETEESLRERKEKILELAPKAPPEILDRCEEIRALVKRAGDDLRARKDLQELQAELRDTRASLEDLDSVGRKTLPPEVDLKRALHDMTTRSKELRDAERTLEAAEKEHRKAQAALRGAEASLARVEEDLMGELALDVAELSPFRGALEDLLKAVPPPPESIEARVQLETARRITHAEFEKEVRQEEKRRREARETIARLESSPGGTPSTPEDLQAARERRDGHWKEIHVAASVPSAPSEDLLAEMEQGIQESDLIADRLIADRERALELSAARREELFASRRLAELSEQRVATEAAEQKEDAVWRALWSSWDLDPAEGSTMQGMLTRTRAVLEKVKAERKSRRQEIERATKTLEERKGELEAASEGAVELRARWRKWLATVGLDSEASEEAAREALEAASASHRARTRLAELEPKIEGLEAAIQSFELESEALGDTLRVPPLPAEKDLRNAPVAHRRASALEKSLDAAVGAGGQIQALEAENRTATEKLEGLQRDLADIRKELEELRSRHQASSLDELRSWAAQSESHRRLVETTSTAEQELDHVLPGSSVEEVDHRIQGRRSAELEAERDTLQKELSELNAEREGLVEQIGNRRRDVEGEGSSRAAEIAEQLSQLAAELAELSERYVRACLARALLDQEIDRHRREHQGPLLARAGELFSLLTCGAYRDLIGFEDDKGRHVMEARRANDERVPITGLSTGTTDQLYLALRIASVEQMIRTTEPMPFIADDLFVNFDDERTAAALHALAELSRSTQVIVFSHHGSVRDSAIRIASKGFQVRVHELAAEASS